ncbi:MAG: Gfo/Idh/MocA family oxidoreductase [Lachnospiraceae bacterium]|nr:Gfo/Idh/MocA family oxidoreductase [Lachnospiraceae bacterium]
MIRVGIIGMGNMGSKYARMIYDGDVPGMEIGAITRIKPERLEELPELTKHQVPIYASAQELFQAVEKGSLRLDAVLVVTPHKAHEEQVRRALELGLHVLCDKPSGVFVSQARRMNEVAEIHPELVFGMVFNQRMNPAFRKMKEIVESKVYGGLKRVNWVITDWYRPNAYYDSVAWRGTWEGDGGGILLNQCPHNLDLLQWICGMPVRVQAFCKEGKYHNIEVEDEVTAYLEFSEGATGTFYATTGEAPGINRLEISLEDALLVYEQGLLRVCELGFKESEYRKTATDMFAKLNGSWKEMEINEPNTMHVGILNNFVDAIENGEQLTAPGQEGMKSLTLSNAMYLSSWTKRMVELPAVDTVELWFEKDFEIEFQKKIGQF